MLVERPALNAHAPDDVRDDELQASPQDNVLPTTAEAIVNCRILPDETPAQVKAMLDRTVADPAVIVKLEADDGVGPLLRIDAPVMDAVRGAAARWPG